MKITHEPNVRQTFGGPTASDDRYTPTCPCGWEGEPIVAGKSPHVSWQRAWDAADTHIEQKTKPRRIVCKNTLHSK
jgi:hypothetical protein